MDDSIFVNCPRCGSLIEIDSDLTKITKCYECGWNEEED